MHEDRYIYSTFKYKFLQCQSDCNLIKFASIFMDFFKCKEGFLSSLPIKFYKMGFEEGGRFLEKYHVVWFKPSEEKKGIFKGTIGRSFRKVIRVRAAILAHHGKRKKGSLLGQQFFCGIKLFQLKLGIFSCLNRKYILLSSVLLLELTNSSFM